MARNFHTTKREFNKKEFCYCSGKPKIIYATREDALTDRNKTYKRHLFLRAYLCPRTAYKNAAIVRWHLTSQPPKAG